MRTDRVPNCKLASLMIEATWGNGELARAVNRTGTETGQRLKYDASAVSHWLAGTSPAVRALPVVLEALARRLKRPITAFEAGFSDKSATAEQSTDTVSGLIDLGSADMDPSRRGVLTASLYSVALGIPGWPDLVGRFELLRTNPHTRIGMAEVRSVMAMTERISDLDDQFGGRMARPMAASFLVNTIAPYLQADATEDVRKAMLSAAADHCYLTGYMAMDERHDALAQRYYTKALELAGHAGDHLTYCTTLRGMSVQAVDLGHGSTAMRFADAASAASPQAGPRMRAFLAGQQAHSAAQTGDKAGALYHLGLAEVAMEQAESKAKAFGSYDPSSLAYHEAKVRWELGDKSGAIAAMETSDRLRYSVYVRNRVRMTGMLAEWKLQAGRLEEACVDWHRALDDYPTIQSGRADDRFRSMMAVIKPYQGNRYARDLYDRARPMAKAA
ncbi:tetratricopeptide repeat protein [Kitasatospora sp. NPDC001527]|uniref:tetratricopeptide repeat protein n=1 Tax=Kitasatospora sp. NPDC001527 TaxID=3154519 RepID=UPI0033232136